MHTTHHSPSRPSRALDDAGGGARSSDSRNASCSLAVALLLGVERRHAAAARAAAAAGGARAAEDGAEARVLGVGEGGGGGGRRVQLVRGGLLRREVRAERALEATDELELKVGERRGVGAAEAAEAAAEEAADPRLPLHALQVPLDAPRRALAPRRVVSVRCERVGRRPASPPTSPPPSPPAAGIESSAACAA